MEICTALVHRLDDSRADLESLVSHIDPSGIIYPGWTLKEVLDHITGWDDVVITTLSSHLAGITPEHLVLGIHDYNSHSVEVRKNMPFENSLAEFRAKRQAVRRLLLSATDEQLSRPLALPWGGEGTVSGLIEIFAGHEEEHTANLLGWLSDPNRSSAT